MIWLFPRQEHVLIDWSHDFSMWVLVFKPDLVAGCTGQPDRRILQSADPRDIFHRQIESRQLDLLNYVYEGAVDDGHDLEFLNVSLEYALVASWKAYQFSRESIPRTDVHPAVARAAHLIADADESISLTALAQKAGLSAPRLSRLFKQQTGISLTAFRQRKCLERFIRLYRTGARYTLIEAAFLAGFGSYPQFHRVFCQIMRTNPSSYRRKLAVDRQEQPVSTPD